MESVSTPEDFAGWLPIRVWQQRDGWRVDWCWFDDQALAQPFLNGHVERALRRPFNLACRRETSLDVLSQWHVRSPGQAPGAFIYHASRCGSTLISQVLGDLDGRTVVSEPAPLDVLLRYTGTADLSHARGTQAIAGLLSAYGQRRGPHQREWVIMLDSWSIFQLPLLRECFPETPWVFLYRDPLEIATSHMRHPGLHMVPSQRSAIGLEGRVVDLSREDYIAQRLGRLLKEGLTHCRTYDGLALNYDELPAAMEGDLGSLLNLTPDECRDAFTTVAQHVKRPSHIVEADIESAQAPDLLREKVQRWTDEPYQRLEQLRHLQRQSALSEV